MRHRMDHKKLGRTTEHRIALLRNQAISLIQKDRIRTTTVKAKELRRFVERLITLAKKDTLHARRLAARHVHDPIALKKLFATLGPLYAERPGGYTRVVKLGFRRGDGAEMALVELVGREPVFEDKTAKRKGKKTAPAPKAKAAPEPGKVDASPAKVDAAEGDPSVAEVAPDVDASAPEASEETPAGADPQAPVSEDPAGEEEPKP